MSDMSFASLSPTLLARKGGAKPAMRRQSPMISDALTNAQPHQPGVTDGGEADRLEDLGWNDLGETPQEGATADSPDAGSAELQTSDTQSAASGSHAAASNANEVEDDLAQDDTTEGDFAPLDRHAGGNAAEEAHSASVTPIHERAPRLPRPRLAASNPVSDDPVAPMPTSRGKRTAFTLRLDAERHLKLRMACTLTGRSAQSLVTEAVDAMFAGMPELDPLIARVQTRTHQEG